MRLEGKTALVTGSSRSLGLGCAEAFAREGANVIVNARADLDEANAAAEHLRSTYGVRTMAVRADVSQSIEVKAMAQEVRREFPVVDILVNNVGASPSVDFLKMTEEDWHQVIGINLHSVFYMTKAFVEPMMAQRWGRIVNVTGQAFHGGGGHGAHVNAGKGGSIGLTRSIASAFAPYGITCNDVAPGAFDTPLRTPYYTGLSRSPEEKQRAVEGSVPMGRLGTVEEFAALVTFLAMPEASYITGQTILINGGSRYH